MTTQNLRQILVAEDDPAMLTLLRYHLRPHTLVIAKDGREAMEIIEQEGLSNFSAYVLDGYMPYYSGSDIASRVRNLEREHGLSPKPIIFQTSCPDEHRQHAEYCNAVIFDKTNLSGISTYLAELFRPT